MPLPPLRPSFGDFAGGLEHAVALATLAYATTRTAGIGWLEPTTSALAESAYPIERTEREQRLVHVLQALLHAASCSLDDLRREGFPEHVLTQLGPPINTVVGTSSVSPSA